MGSPWISKKAFLYFGGAFILLLGGAIVVMAPYHATGYIATIGDADAFEIWDKQGFYPQMEVAITVQPQYSNNTVRTDIRIVANETLETKVINMTLTMEDALPGVDPVKYEKSVIVDLEPGPYTIFIDRLDGASDMDVGFTQISDARLYIVSGGIMNIFGLIMGATGYCIKGSVIPTGEEAIVDWGYEEFEEEL